MVTNVDHGEHRSRTMCFTGTVHVLPSTGIGATLANLSTFGFEFPLRQVPGPDNTGIPLSQADGMTARVCGNPVPDGQGGLVLSVTSVQPLLM